VALDDDLRQLGSALGDVRDLDVLIDTLLPMPIEGSGREELLASLEVERDKALAAAVDLLDSPWTSELLERLVDGAADPNLAPQADDPALQRLPTLVAKPWRRLRRSVDMLTDPPRDDDLHSVRILSKRCRYSCDAVRPALGKPARRMARRLAAIQDSLGALNDAVVITARLTALTPALTPAAVFAAGQASGVLKERAVEHHNTWEAAWHELDRKAVTGWLP
jgi:CHAD domain-containing protein